MDNLTLRNAEKLVELYDEERVNIIFDKVRNHLAYSDDEGSVDVKLYNDLEDFLETKDWDEDDFIEEFDFMQSDIQHDVPVVSYEGEAAGVINIAFIDDETDHNEVISTLEGMA